MKNVLLVLFLFAGIGAFGQNVDEILNHYFENTGGKDNWKKVKGVKSIGVMKMQGMEIPFEGYQSTNGEMLQEADFQGKKMIFLAFDGKVAWGVNFMTMKAEKKDNEMVENLKKQVKDVPSPFLDYKEKGYLVSLDGEKEIDGTPTYRVKLEKDSIKIDGKMIPSVEYYYFDKENYVPIMKESSIPVGPMAGQKAETYFGNYQEAGDLFMPYEMTSKMNGNVVQSMVMNKFEINPEFDTSVLKFPEEDAKSPEEKPVKVQGAGK